MTSLPSSKPRPEAPVSAIGEGEPIRALLAGIVDYAGLFPPASLDIESAASAYHRYRRGEHAWMLGAFVVPSARLDELDAAMAKSVGAGAWPISVLVPSLDRGPRESLPSRFDVRAVEVAPLEPREIRRDGDVDDDVTVYFEVPLDDHREARLDAIARVGAAAKVRTGGVEARAFPRAELLADFIAACAERGVPFKATAGLHHPLRGRYALTYEPRSAQCEMFGFLEVALVAVLLRSRRIDAVEAAALLAERHADFGLEADEMAWAGHRVSAQEIAACRSTFFRSFGSCSFEEPVADLTRMGLL